MKKETLLFLIAVPLIVSVVVLAPEYMKFSTVEVNKQPPSIEKKVFDKSHPPKELAGEESATVYNFGCNSEVDYEILEKNQSSNGVFHIRLKVTRVRATLTLAATVWLSQRIPNRRADFENGHAKICERVYVDAHEPAYAACNHVIGRTFYGQNKDLEVAKQEAIGHAKQEIESQYTDSVVTKVKDVFVIYDFYARTWKKPVEILVDKALQEYEVGKPRKLSLKGQEQEKS